MPMDYKAKLLSLLSVPAEADDETIENRVSEIVKQAAGQAQRLTSCAELAKNHKELVTKYDALLNAQVEADLAKFDAVIEDNEATKAALLSNRDATVKLLEGAFKKASAKPGTPLYNRAEAGRPKSPTEGEVDNGPDARARAAKIRNRAVELVKTARMQYQSAFVQATKEFATAGN